MTLVVNPHASIKAADDQRRVLTVRAPVRGQGLKVTTIDRSADPGLFATLLVYAAIPGQPRLATDLTDAERGRLAEIGFLVASDEVPRAVTYACDLDECEPDLVPARSALPVVPADLGDLVVNPTVRLLGESGPTREMRGRLKLADPFGPGRAWLRVDGQGARIPTFLSWSPDRTPALGSLRPGQPVPASVPPSIRRRLVQAGVATTGHSASTCSQDVPCLQHRLSTHRHVVVRDSMNPVQLAAIRRYYRELVAEGFLVFGDRDWPLRDMARYDPIAHFFHEQWTTLVSLIAGQPLKPSFPFFASYHAGADLPAHRDREQCMFSVSVQLDHEPEPVDRAPWPIYLQPGGPETLTAVTLGLGDAALFYGQEVLHHRDALPEGRSSYWFLFYVPQAYDGPLD